MTLLGRSRFNWLSERLTPPGYSQAALGSWDSDTLGRARRMRLGIRADAATQLLCTELKKALATAPKTTTRGGDERPRARQEPRGPLRSPRRSRSACLRESGCPPAGWITSGSSAWRWKRAPGSIHGRARHAACRRPLRSRVLSCLLSSADGSTICLRRWKGSHAEPRPVAGYPPRTTSTASGRRPSVRPISCRAVSRSPSTSHGPRPSRLAAGEGAWRDESGMRCTRLHPNQDQSP
jgi:hypothetical protein